MLDRIDFASWQQRIRLYCQGKENRENILKFIDKGPYKIGTVRETLAESTEGAPQFGPERSRAQENGVALDAEQLLFLVGGQDNAFDDDYVMNNEVPVVHNNVSSVSNDAFMMIYNDMCEPPAQSVSNPSRNTVVKNSLTAKLATYKEHVEL
nr:integrase, catalytic region, zinc finger, CCHC-type, peptidase aspartic, catalytic [Tanacetum cinerariifolium]